MSMNAFVHYHCRSQPHDCWSRKAIFSFATVQHLTCRSHDASKRSSECLKIVHYDRESRLKSSQDYFMTPFRPYVRASGYICSHERQGFSAYVDCRTEPIITSPGEITGGGGEPATADTLSSRLRRFALRRGWQ